MNRRPRRTEANPLAVYNEFEPFAAEWLRNLSFRGHIAHGRIDDRPLQALTPVEVGDVPQFHAFAGLGGWSYALRLAGWPDDEPVWTGSCPCQPFSDAGNGLGFDDPRHLWPVWFRLIEQCRPPVVFGEQVASKAGLAWLDVVRADLEGAGYAVGAADLCAAGVGAPHIRQRLFFVAERLADAGHLARPEGHRPPARAPGGACGEVRVERVRSDAGAGGARASVGLADAERPGLEVRGAADLRGAGRREEGGEPVEPGHVGAPWQHVEWLPCRDGKQRPTQPGLFPLAHGVPGRVGRLRAYGNAIVPEVAATFIRAYTDTRR